MTPSQKAPVPAAGFERGMVERDERPLACPACHLRLSLLLDRLVPDCARHAADHGRIGIVPPSFSSLTAAQNLGVLHTTRPVDHPVPDGVRRPLVLAHVDLVLVPEPNSRAHVQPAFETIHERHRPAVRRIDLAGSAQRVADEAFVGLLVGRIRVPAERLPGPRVGQILVVGIARRARQLRHIGRLENRPGHRDTRVPPTGAGLGSGSRPQPDPSPSCADRPQRSARRAPHVAWTACSAVASSNSRAA